METKNQKQTDRYREQSGGLLLEEGGGRWVNQVKRIKRCKLSDIK